MDTTPLCVFVNKVTASNRIVFGDLRRLQRDVLPSGPSSREEIETLLSLDSIGQVDEDWPVYPCRDCGAVCALELEPAPICGRGHRDLARGALSGARPRSAAAIVRALVSEAQHVDEVLLSGRR